MNSLNLFLRRFLFVLVLLLCQTAHADDGLRYQVRKGDQLGTILSHMGVRALWGETGAVEKTVKINANTVSANGSLILPGTWIILPFSKPPIQSASIQINSNHEVSFVQNDGAVRDALKQSTAAALRYEMPPSLPRRAPAGLRLPAPVVLHDDWSNIPPPPPVVNEYRSSGDSIPALPKAPG